MDSFLRRLLTAVAALFLVAYVAIRPSQLLYSPLETETVRNYSVYDTVDAEGITIRNETVIPAETEGYRYYTLANGSKVAMNGRLPRFIPTKALHWSTSRSRSWRPRFRS